MNSTHSVKLQDDETEDVVEAIAKDDIVALQGLLKSFDIGQFALHRLVSSPGSGDFNVESSKHKTFLIEHVRDNVQTPILLAAMYASKNVLDYFLSCLTQADFVGRSGQDNILHSLCIGRALKIRPESAHAECYEYIHCRHGAIIKEMMSEENSIGLTPLEFSSAVDTYDLLFLYLDCYIVERSKHGVLTKTMYDFSIYHPLAKMSRYHLSPILMLMEANSQDVVDISKEQVLDHDIVKAWRTRSIHRCIPLYLYAGVQYLICTLFYSFAVVPGLYKVFYEIVESVKSTKIHILAGNVSVSAQLFDVPYYLNCSLKHGMETPTIVGTHNISIFLFICFSIFSLDIFARFTYVLVGLIRYGKFSRLLRKEGSSIRTSFYDINNVFLWVSLFTIVFVTVTARSYHIALPRLLILFDIVVPVGSVCCLLSLIKWVEILPGIGVRAIQLRNSLRIILSLVLVYLICLTFFTQIFTAITPCTTDRIKVLGNDFLTEFKHVFSMSLNILTFHNLDMSRVTLVHFFFVMLITVSMLNYMIAVMSVDMAFIEQYHDVVTKLNTQYWMDEMNFYISFPGIKHVLRAIYRWFYKNEPSIFISRIEVEPVVQGCPRSSDNTSSCA